MNVAHFESGSFSVQAAWPEAREAPFVRQLGNRVGLVHELGELRSSEEVFQYAGEPFCRDNLSRSHRIGREVKEVHPLFDDLLHTSQADAALVLDQFADRADASIAQVVDIVDERILIADFEADEVFESVDDIFFSQGDYTSSSSVVPRPSLRLSL